MSTKLEDFFNNLPNIQGDSTGNGHYVLWSCEGEKCKCGSPAKHKVEEVISDSMFFRHPYVRYLCCQCFGELMGASAKEVCEGK